MKLLKPSWVHHDEKPIFSVDVHHECGKFATGGQGNDSGRVVIWNLMPVLSEKAELDDSVPKILCRMDNHLACVNCVRWSQSGLMLASGSDDKLVMIWRQSKGTSDIFDSGGIRSNYESWKCAYTLRGHSGDVLDMAWSPQDRWLASCSIDNTVIVWDVQNFPAMIAMLKGHTGLVKGVAWDPVGKFLASQSDDRSVKIWKAGDWTCSNTITEPFEECGGTTHILRLSWSPDGQYLVSAHAMNGGGPTAQIIEREGWKCDKDFVGHRKAVTCVRFHTSILKRLTPKSQKPQQYCCLAVGSRDRSLSVWMTALQRPLLVIHDLFNDSILDLSWGPQKCILMACSGDGTVACLQFSETELGTPLSEEDRNLLYQRIYGKNAGVLANGSNVVDDMIIEHSELLEYVQDKVKAPTLISTDGSDAFCSNNNNKSVQQLTNVSDFTTTVLPPLSQSQPSSNGFITEKPNLSDNSIHNQNFSQTVINSSSGNMNESDLSNTTFMAGFGKQVETRAADGKRRITPVFIPINTNLNQSTSITSNEGTANSNAVENPKTPRRSTGHGVESGLSTSSAITTMRNSSANEPFSESIKKSTNQSAIGNNTPSNGASTNQNHCRLDSRLVQSSNANIANKPVVQPLTLNANNLPVFPNFQQTPTLSTNNSISITPTETDIQSIPKVHQASTIGPKLQITPTTKCEFQKTALGYRIHVHNGFLQTPNGFLAKVTAFRLGTGKLWETFVGSPIINLNFCLYYVMLCSLDGTLRLIELQTGRPLIPTIGMATMATQCAFSPSGSLVGVITESGILRIWKVKSCIALLASNCSDILSKDGVIIQFHITEQAVPLILCANGSAYSYCSQLQSWLVVNSPDPVTHCGLQASIPKTFCGNFLSYPLTSVQAATNFFTTQTTGIDLNENDWQGVAKITFIENQIKLCQAINSPEELKHWYKMLMYHLAISGNENRMRLILNELLSSSSRNTADAKQKSPSATHILNIPKIDLLELSLNQLKVHLKCQRIYMEYMELYQNIRSKTQQTQ